MSRRVLPSLKEGILEAGTAMFSPVCGLRLWHPEGDLVEKVPRPMTLASPPAIASTMAEYTAMTCQRCGE